MKKIAIQGVSGSFHEAATRKYFGQETSLLYCDTFKELCIATENGAVDFAVMAIENTIAGTLLPNYSLISKYGLKVLGEVYLPIRMNLMALEGVAIKDIRTVISHPIALMQCHDFLDDLGNIVVTEMHDTADAARLISEKRLTDTAAIAAEGAARLYGLNILARDIETNKENFTRFLVLGTNEAKERDCDKASICFEINHTVGSLADVLMNFKLNQLNLTKIQSVPIIGKPYEYRFYADLTWENGEDFEIAIKSVSSRVSAMMVLGVYKKENYAY